MVAFALRYATAKESHVTDVDGNVYLDFLCGSTTLALGHTPELVMARVEEQLRSGVLFSSMTDVEVEFAERIVRLLPSVDQVRFFTTGSEAVHAALGVARVVTGRHRVVKFEGHYHGWVSPICVSDSLLPPFDGTPIGRPGWEPSPEVEVCHWNQLEEVAAALSRPDHDIAAVIMEPIAMDGGILPIDVEFLRGVRALCDQHGVMLIFDEILTGFRVALGGAQERLGVLPDITTIAKVCSSGFPISAVGATSEVWNAASEGGFVTTGGTTGGYSLSCAAGCGALETLERDKDVIYPRFDELSTRLAEGIEGVAREVGAPLVMHHCGPVLFALWGVTPPVETYRQVCSRNSVATAIWNEEMIQRGVISAEGLRWYLNATHTTEHVDQAIDTARGALTATLARLDASDTPAMLGFAAAQLRR
jgi:glutamate-1-semialdehyde 2,1-aminomutase